MDNIYLSVIVPTYNEEEIISNTLEIISSYLDNKRLSWEVIVSDDGSTDNTISKVKSFQSNSEGVVLLANLHKGRANAVREGIMKARGKYILYVDADLSIPIEELDTVLNAFKVGADVVIAYRRIKKENSTSIAYYTEKGINLLVQLILLKGIPDTQAAFKAFTNVSAHKIFSSLKVFSPQQKVITKSYLTGFDVEVLLLAKKFKYNMLIVPVNNFTISKRKFTKLRDFITTSIDLIKIRIVHIY